MYIAMRWMTARDPGPAIELLQQVTTHLNEERGWNAVAATGLTGPSNRVGVLSMHESLSLLLDRRGAVASDPELAEKVSAATDLMVEGSGTDYALRVVHGQPQGTGGTGGDLVYFRSVTSASARSGDLVSKAVEIGQHLESVHGKPTTVATYVGGDGQGVLFGTRFATGDEIEQIGDALAADEQMTKLIGALEEHAGSYSDRIVRIIR